MLLALFTRYITRDLTPLIDRTRCLNSGSDTACNKCASACPHKAISISEKIIFDEIKCRGCGACSSACPALCLKTTQVNWLHILKTVHAKGSAEFGCSASKNEAINAVVPCLGGIPAELFAAVGLLGAKPINLDVGPCYRCKNRKALKQLKPALRKAEKFSGRKIGFSIINSFKNEPPLFVNDHLEGIALRKKLGGFKVILAEEARMFLKTQSINLQHSSDSAGPSLPLSELRKLLVETKIMNKSMTFNLHSWNINSMCTGCNFCLGACLNKAWEYITTNNLSSLIHYPLRCTGCENCKRSCPQNALSPTTVKCSESRDYYMTKRTFTTKRCTNCSRIFIANIMADKRCLTCLKREALIKNIAVSV